MSVLGNLLISCASCVWQFYRLNIPVCLFQAAFHQAKTRMREARDNSKKILDEIY
jgi:hypothetical protein